MLELKFLGCYKKLVSSLAQNYHNNRDNSSILEGLWHVTDELNEIVQYAISKRWRHRNTHHRHISPPKHRGERQSPPVDLPNVSIVTSPPTKVQLGQKIYRRWYC